MKFGFVLELGVIKLEFYDFVCYVSYEGGG